MGFTFSAPTNPYVTTIAQLLAAGPRAQAEAAIAAGNAQARAQELRGQGQASMINAATGTASDLIRMPQALQAQRNQQLALTQEAQLRGLKIQETQGALTDQATARTEKTTAKQEEDLSNYGFHLFQSGHQSDIAQNVIADGVKKGYLTPDDAQQLSTPEAIIAKGAELLGKTPHGQQLLYDTVTNKPGDVVSSKLTGQVIRSVPEKPPPPGTGQHVINGQLVGPDGQPIGVAVPPQPNPVAASAQAETARHNLEMERISTLTVGRQAMAQAETARHNLVMETKPTAASVTIQQGSTDAKAIADAIVSGEQPPDVKGLYRLAGPVRAELAKQGYDMTKANLDWEATKKHLSTLNGAQQTRLRQAISTASDSLGVIEDLAKQWDGGKFPILNKASLTLATNGALGPQAQQIATNLQAQITDVTSELGNVYMGGNSPTDHALGLAQKNLSADWTRDQLLSAIKLARTNLQIRNNSILNSSAITSSSQSAPAVAAPSTPAINVGGFTVVVKP